MLINDAVKVVDSLITVTVLQLHFDRLRAGCRNARLTARLANRELTVTVRLTCGRVARSTVSKPLG